MADDLLLERWKAVADHQIKFIDALGEYQVKAMTALKLQIEAEILEVERQTKLAALHEIQVTFKRLNVERHEIEKQTKTLKSKATDASFYFLGESITPSLIANVWIGYRFFITKLPGTVRAQIDGIPITDSARSADNFFRNPQLGVCEAAPADKTTCASLINWLIKQNYIPVRGSAAAERVDQAFDLIAETGKSQVTDLQTALAEFESNTFETFDPLRLAGLPPKPAAAGGGG